jgi:hypothetical protein
MEQTDDRKESAGKLCEVNEVITNLPESYGNKILPSLEKVKISCKSASCMQTGCGLSEPNGAETYPYVYAIGKITTRFPSLGIEKEFRQAIGRAGEETVGFTDQKAFHKVLSVKENHYLVRKLCWVLTIEGMDTYILRPRNSLDFDSLVEAIRPSQSPMDIDIVIGVKGPIAPPEMCNGLMVPILVFDQIYSFDRVSLIEALNEKRPDSISKEEFTGTAEELLDRIMQIADNAGAMDEHRALNYLAVRYDAIYAKAAEMHGKNFSLTGVEVGSSRLSGTRKIVASIFIYTHRETDVVEKYFVRVDVTEEFPFLVTKLSPYYDR